MKKTGIISILAVCAVLVSGCSQKNPGAAASGTSAETTTTTAIASEPEVTTPAETTTTTAAAPDIEALNYMFGGYVNSENDAELMSEPKEGSEVLASIPAYTQLDIYQSGTDGWYVVSFDGKTGYIKADLINTIPDDGHSAYQSYLFRGYAAPESGDELYLLRAPMDDAEKDSVELTYGTIMEIYSCDADGWYYAEINDDYAGYIRADKVLEWPHTLPFGTPLFGGYVATEHDIDLFSEADENSESIRKIESGTQLDIYESDYEGWFTTEMANQDGSFDIGFVKSEYIAAIEPYDEGAYSPEPSFTDLVGVWYEADTLDSRTLTVNPDGTYKLEYRGGGASYGKVMIEYEEYNDGSRLAWYNFREDDGKLWEGFPSAEPNTHLTDIYAGQSGEPHFVRAVAATDTAGLEDAAVKALSDLSTIMGSMAGGSTIALDESSVLDGQPEGKKFVKIIDNRFGDPEEGLESWISNICTGSIRDSLVKSANEMFIAKDGALYVDISSPHGFYIFPVQDGVEISDVTDTSFTAVTRASNEMDGRCRAKFVKDGYRWLIESYEFI